jgi:polyphosphate kinase
VGSAQQLVKTPEIVIEHQTESLLILKEIENELETKYFIIDESQIS